MKSKVMNFLMAFVIAVGLWMYVITIVSPGSEETYYNIPVVLEGESVLNNDRGLMVTDISHQTVAIKLSGNRSDLAKVNSGNITVKADLSKFYEPGSGIQLNYTISFPGDIANNAFVTESKSPASIYLTLERRLTKEVPVEIQWVGSAPDGFMSDRENCVLDHQLVTVTGPESVVNEISKAMIQVDLTEQRESISQDYQYTLCNEADEPVDAELIVTNVEQIHLDVRIQRVKDVRLAYTLVEGGGATAEHATVTLSAKTIRVSGSESALELLGDEIVVGTVNLAEINKSSEIVFGIQLPEGVTNLTGITEVTAEVKLSGLATKEFVLEKIDSINLPENLEAEVITEKLTVVVRGETAAIAKLKPEDLSVAVDLSKAEVGTSTYKAVVTFAEGFQEAGVMKVDAVSVTVTAKEG